MQIDDLNEQIEQMNSRKSQENMEKEQIQSFINTRLFEIKFIRQIQILQGMESTMKSMQDKEKTSEDRRKESNDSLLVKALENQKREKNEFLLQDLKKFTLDVNS